MRSFRLLLSLTLFLFITFCSLLFNLSRANAANAVPNGGGVPCGVGFEEDPEFNSGRPYQASPCGDSNKALFCSNSVVVTLGTVSTKYCGAEVCKVDIDKRIDRIVVDLTNVQLPVLGNTQQVKNSQNPDSQIDEATRMNEYVTSYLGGTTDQAEYGNTDPSKTVDFSGPLKKLLPTIIQDAQRIETIKTITTPATTTTNEETGETVEDFANHNQIAVCADNSLGIFGDILGIGTLTPRECYDGNGSGAQGNEVLRLNSWVGDLSGWNTGVNTLVNAVTTFLPSVPKEAIRDSIGDHWNKRWPPLPWNDEADTNTPFASEVLYQKAYNEWRGKTCVLIPVIEKLICIDNVFVPNQYADLFPYIPLANTVDKNAGQTINSVIIQSGGRATIDQDSKHYEIVKSPVLYFPHTQESADLSSLLQKTFKAGGIGEARPQPMPKDVENNSSCQTIPSYTNPGDDVTFDDPRSYLEIINIQYHVSEIKCTNPRRECDEDPLTGLEINCKTEADCSDDIYATIPMQNKTPYLNEIWDTTVAGNQSIFRRIYPQTGTNSPVSCIADIPGASEATYTSREGPAVTRVEGPNGQGTKAIKGTSGVGSQMFFPHLGGIAEYFLKGVQTALRPQGYGQQVTNGICINTGGESGACKQWLFEKDSKGELYYDKVIAAANGASCKGGSLNPFWAIAIALNENGGLMSDSATGESNTHFGCNISQLQTIEEKISCMVNTLRNDCLAGKPDGQILSEYGYPAGYIMYPITVLANIPFPPPPDSSYPPPLFGSGFDTEQLIANLTNTNWVEVYKSQAQIFCPKSPILESTN